MNDAISIILKAKHLTRDFSGIPPDISGCIEHPFPGRIVSYLVND